MWKLKLYFQVEIGKPFKSLRNSGGVQIFINYITFSAFVLNTTKWKLSRYLFYFWYRKVQQKDYENRKN